MSVKRENLIRAMNRLGKQAWSPESQALNLLLHDLSTEIVDGWQIRYEVADDLPLRNGESNLDVFDEECKSRWHDTLDKLAGLRDDPDARDDALLVPPTRRDGGDHHVLIELVHIETGAHMHHWVPRAALATIARSATTDVAKLSQVRALCVPKRGDLAARVARRVERQPQ